LTALDVVANLIKIEDEPPDFFFEKFVRYKSRGFATENFVFYKI